MTKKILIILIALAVMFTVSAYKKQTHKVDQLNGTITTIEQQKQSTETELQKTKETDSQNQQKIKELEEKIKQLEADLQAREARKKYLASLDQPQWWMLEAGIPEDQWATVYQLVMKESTWDFLAVNPSSGALGLCQALPGNKMASAGYDYATNPITQLKWCHDYAQQRYGGWSQAWVFWQANRWW
jgi:TolA-binding protein